MSNEELYVIPRMGFLSKDTFTANKLYKVFKISDQLGSLKFLVVTDKKDFIILPSHYFEIGVQNDITSETDYDKLRIAYEETLENFEKLQNEYQKLKSNYDTELEISNDNIKKVVELREQVSKLNTEPIAILFNEVGYDESKWRLAQNGRSLVPIEKEKAE